MGDIILEIVKNILPAIAVMLITYLVMKSFLEREVKLKKIDVQARHNDTVVPIRLQAYERISLMLERANFNNLIPRVRQTEMNAKEMQFAMVSNIRMEYEHNLTQQIYVSVELWRIVVFSKDETIKIINLVSATMPTDASGNDLSRAILHHVMESEEPTPALKVIEYLKEEVKTLF